MKIIFCNITYLRYYDGRTAGELTPVTGGRWVKENSDAHECWNFLNMDGKCYGFVQGLSDTMHIERLEGVSSASQNAEDVTVIWCALRDGKTVIIGWYEHATAYRSAMPCFITPISGLERVYWFETDAENAYLLPENMRNYKIGRASIDGMGKGFGQYNYWFADSEYAKKEIVPKVLDYIQNNREHRINAQTSEFLDPGNTSPLTVEEEEYVKTLGDDQGKEYLPYGYRIYAQKKDADSAYYIAEALESCYQYKLSLPWFEKVIELDPDDIITAGRLGYIYQQCGLFEKSRQIGERILKTPNLDEHLRDEFYCMIADSLFWQHKIPHAIDWLDRILSESSDNDLKEFTKKTREGWKNLLH